MTDVSESYLESLRDRAEFAEETLTAEQREHDVTRRQLTASQEELVHEQGEHEFTTKKVDHLMGRCDGYRDELIEERRLNNAALKPSAKVLQQNQDDEMACMAEEVEGLKYRLKISTEYGNTLLNETKELTQKIDALEFTQAALCTEVSKLAGYKVELESSAETQALHMQQVDAACKAAEAEVIEQRKEIEALQSGDDLWICPNVDECYSQCYHSIAHKHDFTCVTIAGGGLPCTDCVKVNPCKECATLREEIAALTMNADRCAICENTQMEEIINRDAVIVQQESMAEDREEIINALAKGIKMVRQGEIVATGSGCGEPSLALGKFKIAFPGKRECMVKQGVHTRLLRNGDIVTVNPVITIRDV